MLMSRTGFVAIALLILFGVVFAWDAYRECYTSGDCAEDEYCNSNGECVPYESGTNNISCCGMGAILLAVIGLGAFVKGKI